MAEARKPQLAVGVFVFDAEQRLLLIQRARDPGKGLWTIPGGRVEFGERIKAACRREVREETGLDVTIADFVTVFERVDGDYHYVIVDYLGLIAGSSPPLVADDDAAQARWVETAELTDYPLTDGLLPVVPQALALAGKVAFKQ